MMLQPQRRGVGQTDYTNLVPGTDVGTGTSYVPPPGSFTMTTAPVDTNAANALQDALAASTAVFFGQQQAAAAATPSQQSSGINWGTIALAIAGFGVVLLIAPRRR